MPMRTFPELKDLTLVTIDEAGSNERMHSLAAYLAKAKAPSIAYIMTL
jgi:hypothetical protein